MNTNEQQTRQIASESQRRAGERPGSSHGPGDGAGGWHLDVTRRREHTDAAYAEVEAVHDAIVPLELLPQKQIAAWQVLNPSLANVSSLKSTELKDSSADERSMIETKKYQQITKLSEDDQMDMSFGSQAKEKLLLQEVPKAAADGLRATAVEDQQLFQGKVPVEYGWWLGKCFFTWVNPLIDFARKYKKLRIPDLGNLGAGDDVQIQVDILRKEWAKQISQPELSQHALFKAVLLSYRSQYLYIMVLNILLAVLRTSSIFIIHPLVNYIKDGQNAWAPTIPFHRFSKDSFWHTITPEAQYGMSLALILIFTQALSFVLQENITYMQAFLGTKSTNALIGFIYEKQLKLSAATNKSFKNGEIITFVQVDAQKLQYLSSQLPAVATLPFTISICFGLLFYYLGLTFFAGIGIFILSMILNICLSRILARFQKQYMARQDLRVSSTTELINNIKMIKLYSWVDIFKNLVFEKRTAELNLQFKRMNVLMLTMASLTFAPLFLQTASFSLFIGLGQSLNLAVAYTVLTIFQQIQSPIRWLPMFIGQLIEFTVAMERIQNFLRCDEINETIVHIDPNRIEAVSIQGNYHWGLEKQQIKQSKLALKRKKKLDEFKPQTHNKDDKIQSQQVLLKDTRTVNNALSLRNLQICIAKGEFVCIIGDVGAGKSSLLSAIIGDMLCLPQSFVEENAQEVLDDLQIKKEFTEASKQSFNELSSPIHLQRNVSYVQQVPWIQNKNIKDNICFGQPLEKERYERTIDLCELRRDLEILPAGDLTEIGEKGITLSGGQKARVSLARAVYADRDIILMDDPISALDAEVKKKIFQKVLIGELKHKTRILVTHAVDFLHLVDKIIVIKEGEIILSGSYEQIKTDPYVSQLMKIYKSHENDYADLANKPSRAGELDEEQIQKGLAEGLIEYEKENHDDFYDCIDEPAQSYPESSAFNLEISMLKQSTREVEVTKSMRNAAVDQTRTRTASNRNQLMNQHNYHRTKSSKSGDGMASLSQTSQQNAKRKSSKSLTDKRVVPKFSTEQIKNNQKMMTDENEEKISVSGKVYWQFYSRYYGFWFVVCSQLSLILFTGAKILNDYLIGQWALSEDQHSKFWYYTIASVIFIVLMTLGVYGRVGSCQLFTWRASKNLHTQMINRTVLAPVNLYFDITPVGRILNKFSKDLNAIETQQGWLIGMIFNMVYMLLQVFAIAIYAVPWIAMMLPFLFIISYLLVKKVTNALRETVRLTNTTKSPLLSYLGETSNGLSTIRAFGMTSRFIAGNNQLLNDNIIANQMMAGVAGWFAIKVDMIAVLIMSIVTVTCVLCRSFTNPIILSMLLSYTLTIQMTLTFALKGFMNLQSNMVNADRCMKLLELPQESLLQNDVMKSRPKWPESGFIEFQNVSLKYRPWTETVLHELSFKVNVGEKIGIVGRTGAGKSTICLAISRIVEIFEGKILIDGLDIGQIPLAELRSRITVIPQDPTMFTGTLRFNLDPEGFAMDQEITQLLIEAQLENILQSHPDGLDQLVAENGQNLSSGERQLICICRAILRKSKVVILDEATANIDMITEQKIQSLITTQFQDSTMLTIAHRLNTIQQSDRILVLSFGRIKEFDSPATLMRDPESEFNSLLKELQKEQHRAAE